jgi:hypothetical protein
MTPEEVIRACLGEIYRYRQAIAEQLPRIEAATVAVKEEREAIERDKRDLLVAPSMSTGAFEQELSAIHHRDIPYSARLKTEGQFLLVSGSSMGR